MRIRLLGGLEITSPERRPVRFATRKTSLLFAALVLAGRRGHRRELLSEAFWPGRSNGQARNSLRQALVDIRRSFPTSKDATVYIDGDQEAIALIAGPDDADISIFDRKLEQGGAADLAFAADLYRGGVLAGEAIPEELDEWFGPYLDRYQRKALQLVDRLSLALPMPGSAEEDCLRGARGEIARFRSYRGGRPSGAYPDPCSSRSRKRGLATVRALSDCPEKAAGCGAGGADKLTGGFSAVPRTNWASAAGAKFWHRGAGAGAGSPNETRRPAVNCGAAVSESKR